MLSRVAMLGRARGALVGRRWGQGPATVSATTPPPSHPPPTQFPRPGSTALTAVEQQKLKEEVATLRKKVAETEALQGQVRELQKIGDLVEKMQDKIAKDIAERGDRDGEITAATKLQDIPVKLRVKAEKAGEQVKEKANVAMKQLQLEMGKRGEVAKQELPKLMKQAKEEMGEKGREWGASEAEKAYDQIAKRVGEFEQKAAQEGGYKLALVDLAMVGVLILFIFFQHLRTKRAKAAAAETVANIDEHVRKLEGTVKDACQNFREEFLAQDKEVADCIQQSVQQTAMIHQLTESIETRGQ
eukprot:Hpha_TRINITY_DN15706_c1_g1::TRINITY_DN15706_c1_g1_i1::g.37517::m.37517